MSAKTDNIIQDAEAEAGTAMQYCWEPFLSAGGVPGWIRGSVTPANIGTSAGDATGCFDYPLLLCIRRGYLRQAQVDQLFRNLIGADEQQKAGAFAYWGYNLSVWKDWAAVPGDRWRPRRGDRVFFSTPDEGDINHVVLACGTADAMGRAQVVSFGEGLSTPQQAPVRKTTVEQLEQAGHTAVKGTQPLRGTGRGRAAPAARPA